MHRSGTSFITRALNILGVDLGPEDHAMKPNADNPRGFSEHQGITDLNDEILAMLGGNWHSPPPRQADWANDPRFDDLKGRAARLLEEDFGDSPLWGWKDPRTCLTLPFWQQLVPSMRYVVCVRSPLDVALSLQARDGFSIEKSGALWVDYLSGALTDTTGQPRMLVSYDDLIERQDVEVERLAGFIDRSWSSDCLQSDVESATDLTLRHHQTQIGAVLIDARLPFPAKALYLCLLFLLHDQHSRATPPPTLSDVFEADVETLSREALADDDSASRLSTELVEARRQAAAAGAELAQCQRERDEIQGLAASLLEQFDAQTTQVLAITENRDAWRDGATHLQAEAEQLRQRLAYVETRIGSIRTALRVLLPRRLYTELRRTLDRA
jgi:hypothetical protein